MLIIVPWSAGVEEIFIFCVDNKAKFDEFLATGTTICLLHVRTYAMVADVGLACM